jgi:O-antigen/teichoic acid export membrane protein
VFSSAWPMFVQMIAFPIAMQTDRVILSHVSDVTNMARYNLGSQIFTPVWQVVAAAGAALWPVFARQRAERERRAAQGATVPAGTRDRADPFRLAGWFGLAAGVVSGVLAVASPLLSSVATGGVVTLPVALLVAFIAFMVVQAAKYPLGMYMTDDPGLRFQAAMMIAMLPVNLGLSWWLGATLGAIGPVIGSVVGVFLCQVAGPWWWIHRRERALGVGFDAPEPTSPL